MKASLKTLAESMKPEAAAPGRVRGAKAPAFPRKAVASETAPTYRVAQTRTDTRQISAHYPADAVQAFRVLAAELDMDVQELLAEAINMTFERHGKPDRIDVVSGRRKRRA